MVTKTTMKTTKAAWSLLILALMLAPAAVAGEPAKVEIHAYDQADDCREEAPCLEDIDPGWNGIYAGDAIEVLFVNDASQPVELAIVPGAQRAEDGDTSTEEAFLRTGEIEPGASHAETVTVPEDADTAYLFVPGQEDEGMQLVRNVYPADAKGEEGTYTTQGDDDGEKEDPASDEAEQNPAPVPAVAALLALALAGARAHDRP